MAIVWFLVLGFVAGLVARAVVPGKDDMNIIATLVLGVIGSFAGGAIGALFSDNKITDFNTSGILLSIVGAVVVLLVYNRFAKSRV